MTAIRVNELHRLLEKKKLRLSRIRFARKVR